MSEELRQEKLREMPPAIILCGGYGTRFRDVSDTLPKPMAPIGEYPIVWHIMKTYASFGVKRFILCLGYMRNAFVDYFVNYHLNTSDITVKLGNEGRIQFHGENEEADWEVTLAGTGIDTMTGGRVARAVRHLKPSDQEFFLTYGDGVADVDVLSQLDFHRQSGKLMTVTAVSPAARFGEMLVDGGNILGFQEKPAATAGCINGGYMVVSREFVQRYLDGSASQVLEQEPMMQAAADGALAAWRHHGFWQCMDNSREFQLLNELWNTGKAPWTAHWS